MNWLPVSKKIIVFLDCCGEYSTPLDQYQKINYMVTFELFWDRVAGSDVIDVDDNSLQNKKYVTLNYIKHKNYNK